MSELLRKLSPETIIGKIERPNPTDPVRWIYRVAGIAVGSETGTSNFGEWTSLKGDFQAVRFDTGEIVVSDTCFLPGGIAETIAMKLKAGAIDPTAAGSPTPTNQVQAITIQFDIGYKPSNPNRPSVTGYEYVIRNPDPNAAASSPVNKLLTSFPMPPGVKALAGRTDSVA